MSCSPFDLKDYVFGELPAQDARTLEIHVASCSGCREEIQRLRLTHTALLGIRDEEIPRRIAFVSDKVFEPNWWQRFWRSGPRLGFASAAMLSLAILMHGITRPAPQTTTAPVDVSVIEARVQDELVKRLDAAIEQAVSRAEQRQTEKLAQVVAASEKRQELQRRADLVTVAENYDVIEKRLMRMEREGYNIASNGAGR
jgi:anti-sigma factor RsiW